MEHELICRDLDGRHNAHRNSAAFLLRVIGESNAAIAMQLLPILFCKPCNWRIAGKVEMNNPAQGLAHYWDKQIDDGVVVDASEIAQREQMEVTRVREVLRLVILDPQITEAILEGRQPRTLSLESLVRQSLPLDWEAQREMITNVRLCSQ